MARVKFAPLFMNSKKMAYLENVEFDINSGDEPQIGSDGYLTHSDGAIVSNCTATSICPVSGVDPDILLQLLQKNDVQIGLPIDGRTLKAKMRPVTAKYSSSPKNGHCQGTFTFGGGAPKST